MAEEQHESASDVAGTTSIEVVVKGTVCKLVLTPTQIRMHSAESIFQDATTVIPIASVDSVFFGWKRNWVLLLVGGIFTMAGLALASHGGGILMLFIGIGSLITFWLYRPGLLRVNSGRESLGGTPVSEQAAKRFIDQVASSVALAHK